jgi:hypothetical protein
MSGRRGYGWRALSDGIASGYGAGNLASVANRHCYSLCILRIPLDVSSIGLGQRLDLKYVIAQERCVDLAP